MLEFVATRWAALPCVVSSPRLTLCRARCVYILNFFCQTLVRWHRWPWSWGRLERSFWPRTSWSWGCCYCSTALWVFHVPRSPLAGQPLFLCPKTVCCDKAPISSAGSAAAFTTPGVCVKAQAAGRGVCSGSPSRCTIILVAFTLNAGRRCFSYHGNSSRIFYSISYYDYCVCLSYSFLH